MEKEIVIKPNYIFKDYYKIYILLYFNKLSNKIVSIFLMVIILFNLYTLLSDEIEFTEIFSGGFVFILFYPFLTLLVKYKQTKTILSNPKLKENIFIKLNSINYEIIGESFNIKFNWTEIKEIIEKKNWFLIYISNNDIKLIRKADLKENQYTELKELFNSINIKKSLK